MQRNLLKQLHDIRESINSINEFLGESRSFATYRTNKLLRRAVERELEIIGESTKRILNIDETIAISDARRIVDYETGLAVAMIG